MRSHTTSPDTQHPTHRATPPASWLASSLAILAVATFSAHAQCIVGDYTTSGANGVAVVGSTTYIADGGNNSGRRLAIFDTSNPESPVLLGSWLAENGGFVNDVAVVGNTAYLACRGPYVDGLSIIDVSDPTAPVKIGGYNISGNRSAIEITVVDDIAYIAAGLYGGLQIIDVSNPQAPAFLGSINTDWALDVAVVGNIAYVADDRAGLAIVDVSDPTAPALLSTTWLNGAAYGVDAIGTTIYIANGLSNGLVIVDASDPTAPTILGRYTDISHYAQAVTVVGDTAYLAARLSGLHAIDVSDPTAPMLLHSYNTPGMAYAVTFDDTLAYVADSDEGLQIINVTTCPCAPDLNEDGMVNTQDFILFLSAWANEDPLADWNGDGTVNTLDFVTFLNEWVAGC